ncbi:MAG TPA: flagellar hook-length control protein FliK, partial [Rhodopila sp.]|nr:flagellar hook-length control protein FliK [Rhodopila sp.]
PAAPPPAQVAASPAAEPAALAATAAPPTATVSPAATAPLAVTAPAVTADASPMQGSAPRPEATGEPAPALQPLARRSGGAPTPARAAAGAPSGATAVADNRPATPAVAPWADSFGTPVAPDGKAAPPAVAPQGGPADQAAPNTPGVPAPDPTNAAGNQAAGMPDLVAASASQADPVRDQTARATDKPAATPDGAVSPGPAPSETAPLATVAATPQPSAAPGTSQASAPPPAAQPHPASPAAQLAPALLTLGKTADGGQQVTVRLQPADLGLVQVKITQTAAGTAHVAVTADNPATLQALQSDQAQLSHALDRAGIPMTGRSVSFHEAPAGGGGTDAGHAGNQPEPHGANRDSAAMTDADGAAAGGRGFYPARGRRTSSAGGETDTLPATGAAQSESVAHSHRIGLDITA